MLKKTLIYLTISCATIPALAEEINNFAASLNQIALQATKDELKKAALERTQNINTLKEAIETQKAAKQGEDPKAFEIRQTWLKKYEDILKNNNATNEEILDAIEKVKKYSTLQGLKKI